MPMRTLRLSPPQSLRRTLPVLLLLPILVVCATPAPIAVTKAQPVDLACGEFPRLTFDRLHDTLPTIAEIKSYDAGRDKLCGAGK